ncbi:MAG: hypothetical protein NUV58_02000 [Candidatus Roizmanbacteria bacterium]|nr:hypothetical protein [Candidatus Roizmanbacteria bacterium]
MSLNSKRGLIKTTQSGASTTRLAVKKEGRLHSMEKDLGEYNKIKTMNNSERIFEKFYDVFKPRDLINALLSGNLKIDRWAIEKIDGFLSRHVCDNSPSCECIDLKTIRSAVDDWIKEVEEEDNLW